MTILHTALMRSTLMIHGPAEQPGNVTIGTAFILFQPMSGDPTRGFPVLVTALHVFKDICGPIARVNFRSRVGEQYTKVTVDIPIRIHKRPLWAAHPSADVAAIRIMMPASVDVEPLSTELLVTDAQMVDYEIHPGETVSALGYPHGAEANAAGFPILRTGEIASYPLVPTANYPSFLFDFPVFPGNSGGPVYFVSQNRTYGNTVRIGNTVQGILGLVSQRHIAKVVEQTELGQTETSWPLDLASVVTAPIIRETLSLLPPVA